MAHYEFVWLVDGCIRDAPVLFFHEFSIRNSEELDDYILKTFSRRSVEEQLHSFKSSEFIAICL